MEDHLSRVVGALPGLVWTALADGRVDFVNQRWCEYSGLGVDESCRSGWQAAIHPDELPAFLERWQSIRASGEAGEIEARLCRFDGAYRWYLISSSPIRDEAGRIVKWCGISIDIDERKRAEQDLRARAEGDFRSIADSLPALIALLKPNGEVETVNRQTMEYFGATLEQMINWSAGDTVHPDDLPRVSATWMRSVATEEPYDIEQRVRRADGVYRWFHLRGLPARDNAGRVVRWCVLQTDIDDRKRAEEALRASERNLRRIVDSIPGLVCTMSPAGEVQHLNQQLLEYFGKTPGELKGWAMTDAVHPDDLARVIAAFSHSIATGSPYDVEHRCRRADGVYRWFQIRALPVRDPDGGITGWYVLLTDIEHSKRAEEALRASEHNLNQIINTIPTTAWSTRPDGYCEFLNQRWLDYAGFSAAQAEGWGWGAAVHPDDVNGLVEYWQSRLASGLPVDVEARMRRLDGVYRWFIFRANPLRDESGTIIKWYGTNIDIEDRKRAEDGLRRSEAFLAQGQRLTLTGSFLWRVDTDEITFSEQLYRIFEFEMDSPVTFERMAGRVHPEDLSLFSDKIDLARRGTSDHDYEIRLLMPDASVKYVRATSYGTRDRDGRLEYIGAMQDVTERRLAEEALGKARSDLAHVSRVTTLGVLTASIAHEINQPLAGIVTNASTCLRMLAADPPDAAGACETARRTIRDATRASDVITRLRALFAKKETATELVDLNEAAREVIALSSTELQRNRVMLRPELADDIPVVTGDRIQLQQVILNLVRNASDAMTSVADRPRQLAIRTERDEGDRVRLSVQDTGVGLDPQRLDKLFDAFYTTRRDGMGIGLSVSRSIIESHHGRLWAEPNDGPGATFAFSIPRVQAAAGTRHPQ